MNYEEFKKELVLELKKRISEEGRSCQCKIKKIPKVNCDADGLYVVVDEKNVVLDLNELYDAYGDSNVRMSRVAEEVDKLIKEQISNNDKNDIVQKVKNLINDKEECSKRIIYYTINANCNENMLKLVPNRMYLDLMVIYRLVVDSDENGIQSMIITNEQMKLMGMTEKSLYEAAVVNTPKILSPRICKMYEGVQHIEGMELLSLSEQADRAIDGNNNNPVKITCMPRVNGSFNLVDMECIKLLAEKMDSDLYVLPSSIQEIMCVKVGGSIRLERLCAIVREANTKTWVVSDESYLSDSVYIYKRKKGVLSVIANK